jgi:hypothetical protein
MAEFNWKAVDLENLFSINFQILNNISLIKKPNYNTNYIHRYKNMASIFKFKHACNTFFLKKYIENLK